MKNVELNSHLAECSSIQAKVCQNMYGWLIHTICKSLWIYFK